MRVHSTQLGEQCGESTVLPQHNCGQHVDIFAQTANLGEALPLLANEEPQIRLSVRVAHGDTFLPKGLLVKV